MLLNILMNDLIFFASNSDKYNFADHDTVSSCGEILSDKERISKRKLYNTFVKSQFFHARLIWKFAGNLLMLRVQKINFRSLRMIHNTYDRTHDELRSADTYVSLHQAPTLNQWTN